MKKTIDNGNTRYGLLDQGKVFEQDFGNGFTASLAMEEDIDEITDFLQLFGFPNPDRGTGIEVPFYVSPALPLGSYSETDIRSRLFHYSAVFFMLRKNGLASTLLSFRFPLPQYAYRAVVIELILNKKGEDSTSPLLSELLNFAFDCLPGISIIECTKVKGLVLKDSVKSGVICDFFTKNGFSEESILRDEFGPKRDVAIFSRWLSQRGCE